MHFFANGLWSPRKHSRPESRGAAPWRHFPGPELRAPAAVSDRWKVLPRTWPLRLLKSRSSRSSSPAPRRQGPKLRKSNSSAVAVGVVGAHDSELRVVRCMQVPAGPLSQLRYSHFVSNPSLARPTHALQCGNAKGCLYLVADCHLWGGVGGGGEKDLKAWGGGRQGDKPVIKKWRCDSKHWIKKCLQLFWPRCISFRMSFMGRTCFQTTKLNFQWWLLSGTMCLLYTVLERRLRKWGVWGVSVLFAIIFKILT